MAKDPAFLFYPNDWVGGTMGMSFQEKGAYIEVLMMQFNRGHMTEDMIGHAIGQLWGQIKHKFIQDENGLWYNVRLEVEQEKRRGFVKSRYNNKLGNNQHSKENNHIIGHTEGHMTNDMEDVNVNSKEDSKIEGKGKVKKGGVGERNEKGKEERKKEETPKQSKTHTTSTTLLPITVTNVSDRDISAKTLNRISMPFGESFASLWLEWRKYRWEQHQFKFKNDGSEQAALHELMTLARGAEDSAAMIIKQSMARGWKGFFEIKNTNYNGATKQPTGKDVELSDLYAAINRMPD